jgi:hypothetical protein
VEEEIMAVTADQYGELCDVVERAYHQMPVDSHKEDPHRHTSDYARAAARRIVDLLGLKDSRPLADILDAEQEYFERLWYFRSTSVPSNSESPEIRERVAQIEAAYGDDLKAQSPEYVSGALSALRWVLGHDWHDLDT